jgi:Sigma-70, region 4
MRPQKHPQLSESALGIGLWPDEAPPERCSPGEDECELGRKRRHVREQGRGHRRQQRRELQAALRRLGRRERVVVMRRFGLSGGRPETLEEIGHGLGISRAHVRSIEAFALTRLASFSARSQRILRISRPARPNLRRGALGRGRSRIARRRRAASRGSPGGDDSEPEPPLAARRSPRRGRLLASPTVAR